MIFDFGDLMMASLSMNRSLYCELVMRATETRVKAMFGGILNIGESNLCGLHSRTIWDLDGVNRLFQLPENATVGGRG